jgi:transcriptional regulator with XRE-family HTH domain
MAPPAWESELVAVLRVIRVEAEVGEQQRLSAWLRAAALGLDRDEDRVNLGNRLSAATGYSQRTVGMIERGEKSPTLRTIEDFATFYKVPLERLIVQAKRLRNSAS